LSKQNQYPSSIRSYVPIPIAVGIGDH
jgi:hypothetical protein